MMRHLKNILNHLIQKPAVFTLATAGFPLAVAQLVSESSSLGRWNDARQVKQVAMPLFLGVGALGLGAMACLAPLYCRRQQLYRRRLDSPL